MARPTLPQACAQYVHRFTMQHTPAWARDIRPDGTYYAPQYRTDAEWYENTIFPGEKNHPDYPRRVEYCYATGQTWPMGQALQTPYFVSRKHHGKA